MRDNNSNIEFKEMNSYRAVKMYQWDRGQTWTFLDEYIADGNEVQFHTGAVKIITDHRITVPDAILEESGEFRAWLQVIGPNDETTVKTVVYAVRPREKKNDYIEPEDEPTFREEIEGIMEATQAIAQSVRDDADAGRFDGADGHDGRDGTDGRDGRDGTDGVDGADGVSPAVAIADITGGHRVTITDTDGAHTADIMDGVNGQDGRDGTDGVDGADGVSPTVAIADITGGHRVTITDAEGAHTADIMDGVNGQDGRDGVDGRNGADGQDGADGADGVSPTVSITQITGGHRITITDAGGDHTADVMDGANGHDGQDGAPGADGADGTDGEDGYSPTVTITTITGGHRITITDINGAHTADVMDGAGSAPTAATVTLTAAGWVNGSQTVSVTGVTADNVISIAPNTKADADRWVMNGVWCSAQGAGSLTFTCKGTPSAAIELGVVVW